MQLGLHRDRRACATRQAPASTARSAGTGDDPAARPEKDDHQEDRRRQAATAGGIAKLLASDGFATGFLMKPPSSMPRLKGFRFPREIIAYAVWAYHRFALSTADVEDLLAERGVIVSRETVRLWVNRFGGHFAN